MLIKLCVNKQNKPLYVILSLNSNGFFCLCKNNKIPIKNKDRCPGEMMILHDINNIIQIYHLYHSSVYQYESEILDIYQER